MERTRASIGASIGAPIGAPIGAHLVAYLVACISGVLKIVSGRLVACLESVSGRLVACGGVVSGRLVACRHHASGVLVAPSDQWRCSGLRTWRGEAGMWVAGVEGRTGCGCCRWLRVGERPSGLCCTGRRGPSKSHAYSQNESTINLRRQPTLPPLPLPAHHQLAARTLRTSKLHLVKK